MSTTGRSVLVAEYLREKDTMDLQHPAQEPQVHVHPRRDNECNASTREVRAVDQPWCSSATTSGRCWWFQPLTRRRWSQRASEIVSKKKKGSIVESTGNSRFDGRVVAEVRMGKRAVRTHACYLPGPTRKEADHGWTEERAEKETWKLVVHPIHTSFLSKTLHKYTVNVKHDEW